MAGGLRGASLSRLRPDVIDRASALGSRVRGGEAAAIVATVAYPRSSIDASARRLARDERGCRATPSVAEGRSLPQACTCGSQPWVLPAARRFSSASDALATGGPWWSFPPSCFPDNAPRASRRYPHPARVEGRSRRPNWFRFAWLRGP